MQFFGFNTVFGEHGLTNADLILLSMIIMVWPVYSYISFRRHPIEKLRENENATLDSYNTTLLILWGVTVPILLIWFWAGRPFNLLGFHHNFNWQTIAAWFMSILGITFSAVQLYLVHTNQAAREKIRGQLDQVGELTKLFMPKTDKEFNRSMLVGITAGITEEVIFRGYLIWAFSLFMPIAVAGILSIILFILLHLYQDKAGLIQVSGFAIVTTIMFIVSHSLLPVIVLHIGVDILNISLAKKVHETEIVYTNPP
jgi:membrane protease YdiL (CAAX protease family)